MPSKYGFTTTAEDKTVREVQATLKEKIAHEVLDTPIQDVLNDLSVANGWNDSKVTREGSIWFLEHGNDKVIEIELEFTVAIVLGIADETRYVMEERAYQLTISSTIEDDSGYIYKNIDKLQKVLADKLGIKVYKIRS